MRVAFIGNCHAEVLQRVLSDVYRHDTTLETRYFASYTASTDADRAAIAASDLVVRQTADFSNAAGGLDVGHARIVAFPLLLAQFLWPFNIKDHPRRGERIPGHGDTGFFTFPVTDGQVIKLMKERGVGPDSPEAEIEALLDAYMALDYLPLAKLDRQLAFSREKMRRAAEIVGYDLWRTVERDFRSLPTFLTALHPSESIMLELCREVLPRCGFPMTDAAILEAFDRAYGGDRLFAYAAPLHPSVIRHFGLNVPGDPPAYRFYCDGTITAREMARRIVTLDARQPVLEALSETAEGSLDQRLQALDALVLTQGGNATFFLRYGNLLARLGRQEDALRLYVAGLRDAPGHAGLARRVTAMLSHSALAAVPTTVDASEPVDFGLERAGRSMLVGSWNREIDQNAVWLEGYAGALRFRLAPALSSMGRNVALRFRARAFGGQERVEARIFANGREIGLWGFGPDTADDARTLTLDAATAAAPAIELSFHVNRTVSPASLGRSGDTRAFGIGISQMSVSPA